MAAKDKYIIIHSETLLDPQLDADSDSHLDLKVDDEYYSYGIGYLRAISDLTEMGYKLILISEYKEGKEQSEFERLFEHCDGLGVNEPKIYAKLFYNKIEKKPLLLSPEESSVSIGHDSSVESVEQGAGRPRRATFRERAATISRFRRKKTKAVQEEKVLAPEGLTKYRTELGGKFKIRYANYYPGKRNNMRNILEKSLGLKFSKDKAKRAQCFVFCDHDFPKADFGGYAKKNPLVKGYVPDQKHTGSKRIGNMNTKTYNVDEAQMENWTSEAFFNSLISIYLKSTPSAENIFSRLLHYNEYFVDNADDVFFPDKFPLEDVTPRKVIETIDRAASLYDHISPVQWRELRQIKGWVASDQNVFLADKIMGIDVSKLKAHKPIDFSDYSNVRPHRGKNSYDEKHEELNDLLEEFIPEYTAELETMVAKLRKNSESLRSRGYDLSSDAVDGLHDNIERGLFWLNNYYNTFENKPFVQLYGLISCVEDCLAAVGEFMDTKEGCTFDYATNEKLCALDIVKNIGFFLLATLTIVPMIMYYFHYKSQLNEDKRTTFQFFTPQNELIKLHQEVEETIEMPSRGIG